MRKSDAEKNYISGIKKLSAKENPFAEDDREPEHKSPVSLRPRYGWAAAAAVLMLCIAAGALLFRGGLSRDESSSAADRTAREGGSSEASEAPEIREGREPPLKYSNISEAVAAYAKADKETCELLRYRDSLAENSEEAKDALRSEQQQLDTQEKTRREAVDFLEEVRAGVIFLDATSYEGDEGVYLKLYNGLDTELRLTGGATVYESSTGVKYSELPATDSCTIAPGAVGEVRITPETSLRAEYSLVLDEAQDLFVGCTFNGADIISALSRDRTEELLTELEKT
ncbi:MAG: hypothetical protein IJ746_02645 [Ruminococcus sp.]|nr:hypothetical protein [Ruminococcus sp.]